MIYLVFREGVYRHELCGVDTDAAAAVQCAKRYASEDIDDYHSYAVYTTEEGRRAEVMGDEGHSPYLMDAMDLYYTVRRSAALDLPNPNAGYMDDAEMARLDKLRKECDDRAA